jgi:ubiquinone/menaquinone biosynthesis C-methylase UbiE
MRTKMPWTRARNRTPTATQSQAGRDTDDLQGHWVLARLGKRVLRPGGAALTTTLLSRAGIPGAEVVELAPGLGHTAREILELGPRSYIGIDQNSEALAAVQHVVGERGITRVGDAGSTGLPAASADVVVGEAMLTMQGDKTKNSIVAEAARVLRPGGRYAIHELGLAPDDLPEEVTTDIRRALARAIKANARPQTVAEWRHLLESHGLVIDTVDTAPMRLLEPTRLIADEGIGGAARFARNLLTDHAARRRALAVRATFRAHRKTLTAVAIVAHRPNTC